MRMPKASVDEDRFPTTRESDVWSTGHAFELDTESITQSMQQTSDDEFGLRVGPLDARHMGASFSRGELVNHVHTPTEGGGGEIGLSRGLPSATHRYESGTQSDIGNRANQEA
jgi:hypothetical protein